MEIARVVRSRWPSRCNFTEVRRRGGKDGIGAAANCKDIAVAGGLIACGKLRRQLKAGGPTGIHPNVVRKIGGPQAEFAVIEGVGRFKSLVNQASRPPF